MMEAVRTSETSVDNNFTRQYIPEDNSERIIRCNLTNEIRIVTYRATSHSSNVAWVIHGLLLERQSTGRCLASVLCSLNTRGRAGVPIMKGLVFPQ
jgi:hypothetical protein